MMQFSIRRVNAIFRKDWKDLMKNSYIIFTLAFPLIFAAWIGRIGSEDPAFQTFSIHFALVIAGAFVQAAMVAEEKEKNTLRGLMLSPASTAEILVGKSALTAVSTLVVVIGSILLAEYKVPSPPLFILSILLGLVLFVTIGTILGLLSRTVMETTIVGMPVLVIFGMGSMFKAMTDNEMIIKAVDYLPSEQLNMIWMELDREMNISGTIDNILILLAWVVVSFVIAVFVYGKRRFD